MRKFLLPALIVGIVCSAVFTANWFAGKITCPRAEIPIREFMAERVERNGSIGTVVLLVGYIHNHNVPEVLTWMNVPWVALLSAFVLGELKAGLPFALVAIGFITLVLVMKRRNGITAEPQS